MIRPQVKVGDRVVLPPRVAGGRPRIALVADVLGAEGGPPFVLEWDDGSQSIVYPSSDAYVVAPEGTGGEDCPPTDS